MNPKRPMALIAVVIGWAATASAATLTLYPTNTAGVVQHGFVPGETIVLHVEGDSEGAASNGISGRLLWPAQGGTAFAATQSQMFSTVSPLHYGAGFGDVMDQLEPSGQAVQPIDTAFHGTVSLIIGGGPGIFTVGWSFETNFFGISAYYGSVPPPTTYFFLGDPVPEPVTAMLLGLGLVGLALGCRRQTRNA